MALSLTHYVISFNSESGQMLASLAATRKALRSGARTSRVAPLGLLALRSEYSASRLTRLESAF
jgi:hypothetical protein